MKMRRNAIRIGLLACSALMILNSCTTDNEDLETSATEVTLQTNENITSAMLDKINDLGMNPNYVEWKDFYYPDGSSEKKIFVENDIVISPEELDELAYLDQKSSKGEAPTTKQYRTSNLVSRGRTISIIGFTGGSQALSTKERTALQWAVDNYNALNLSINFQLTFGTNYSNKDMVVYNNSVNNDDGVGGSAGFPSNGRPYKFVQIYNMENYDTNVVEHVITHEIGHSVGFRHTDYFSRQSCGQNVNEGGDAILVRGTPSGYDPNSIMLSCFSSGEDGEFGYYDRIALNTMY